MTRSTISDGHSVDASQLVDGLVQQARQLWRQVAAGAALDTLALRRLLICTIEQLRAGDESLLELVTAPAAFKVPETHLVHTTLLALRTGLGLRLGPGELLELATAAMMHGLIKMRGAPAKAKLALHTYDEEPAGAARFARALVRNLCQTNGLRAGSLPYLVVLHEAQQEFSRDDLFPRLGRRGRALSLYGQIIALSAMTSLCHRLDGDEHQALASDSLTSLMAVLKGIAPALVDTFYRSAPSLEPDEPTPGGLQPAGETSDTNDIMAGGSLLPGPGAMAPGLDAPRILLVDDEADIRFSLRHLLEAFGFQVDEAEDGMWGAQKINNGRYDLVILDLMMPHMDGFDLLRSLPPERLQRLPIIILSARGQDEEILQGHKLGATHYLVKPFDNKTILGAVLNLITDLAPEQGRLIERYLGSP